MPPASCAVTWAPSPPCTKVGHWRPLSAGNFRRRRRPAMNDGFIRRLWCGTWRARVANDWAALASADHDAVMTASVGDRFHAKQGRSIVRWTLHGNAGKLVVYLKRHFGGSRIAGLFATIWPTR